MAGPCSTRLEGRERAGHTPKATQRVLEKAGAERGPGTGRGHPGACSSFPSSWGNGIVPTAGCQPCLHTQCVHHPSQLCHCPRVRLQPRVAPPTALPLSGCRQDPLLTHPGFLYLPDKLPLRRPSPGPRLLWPMCQCLLCFTGPPSALSPSPALPILGPGGCHQHPQLSARS